MARKPSGLKPGETVPVSGLYQQIRPRGGKGTEVTSVKESRCLLHPLREPHISSWTLPSTNPGSKGAREAGRNNPAPQAYHRC